MTLFLAIKNDSVVFGLEPLHGIFFHKTMACSYFGSPFTPVRYVHASTAQHYVEVHTVNTDGGIVLDSQIDMFLNTESKVSIGGKVISTQFVFTNLNNEIYDVLFKYIMYSTGGPNISNSLNESKLNFVGKFLPTILELYHWNGYLSLLFLPIPT